MQRLSDYLALYDKITIRDSKIRNWMFANYVFLDSIQFVVSCIQMLFMIPFYGYKTDPYHNYSWLYRTMVEVCAILQVIVPGNVTLRSYFVLIASNLLLLSMPPDGLAGQVAASLTRMATFVAYTPPT